MEEDIPLLPIPNQTFKFKDYDITIQLRGNGYYFTLKQGNNILVNALFIKPNNNLFIYNNKNGDVFAFYTLNNENLDYAKFNTTQSFYYKAT